MNADDDGYCEYFSILRMIAAEENAVYQLATSGFLTVYQDYVLHITHWDDNNQIRKDRYTPSRYKDKELQPLDFSGLPIGNQMATNGKPSIGKDRLGKGSIGNLSVDEKKLVDRVGDKKLELAEQIIEHFNHVTGRDNGTKRPITLTGKTKSQIMARIKEGYTLDDFKHVTEVCHHNWQGDEEFEGRIHPQVLFNNQMDKRLIWKKKDKRTDRERLNDELANSSEST
jgi:uncharacterized phage protein (TIGR02220 family)